MADTVRRVAAESRRPRTRAPSTFRQQDVTKVLRAAVAADLQVAGVKVNSHTGEIELVIGEPRARASSGEEANEWDNIS